MKSFVNGWLTAGNLLFVLITVMSDALLHMNRASNYTVTDMAEDAIGVLDAYHIDKAHLFGMSLGGMIAQIAAVKHPERILTLTLLATSVIGSDNNTRNLPPMDERILTHHANGAHLDWTNKMLYQNI